MEQDTFPPGYPDSGSLFVEDTTPTKVAEEPTSPKHHQFQLSLATLSGPPSPRTLRVLGQLLEHRVTVLIDSGSSHNIMQPRVAQFVGLPITALPPFSVLVGNGEAIQCSGFCSQVPLQMASHTFDIPFYVLPIHGANLVLGVQWLQTLGPFLSDYSIPSIQFRFLDKTITITGENAINPTLGTYSQFCRFLVTESASEMMTVTVQPVCANKGTTQHSPSSPNLQALLHANSAVFITPHGLPSIRDRVHHVHLESGSQPVNVKPYRYPYFQRELITQMINDMLKDGIITPSTSPYSSPVFLVKKKMGRGGCVWTMGTELNYHQRQISNSYY